MRGTAINEYSTRITLQGKEIVFKNSRIPAEEYIDFLKRTDLGSQYPGEDFRQRIQTLVENVAISLLAFDRDKVIGVCFGLTDYAYWLFLSDLGVDREYCNLGIGRRLVQQAQHIAGGKDKIIMVACVNDDAVGFYRKCGWKKAEDFMSFSSIKWTDFTVE